MELTMHCRSIQVPSYTIGFKRYQIDRVKYREISICKNGERIYTDRFKADERETHQVYAKNFLNAMKSFDTKQIVAQLEQMRGV